jgi:hypothetical protein
MARSGYCPLHPTTRLLCAFGGKTRYCPACRGAVTSERKAEAARCNGHLGGGSGVPLGRQRCACGRRLAITNHSGKCRQCQRHPARARRSRSA